MAKDSPRTTAGEFQKIVESRGQKTTSPHVVWEGFKKKSLSSSKNKLQHIQLSDTTGTSNVTGFYGKTQNGFGEHKNKKYCMCTMKYTAVFVYVVGLYICWRSWTSCLDTWHHGFYEIPTDKKNQ